MLSSRLSPRVRGQVNKVNKEARVNKILSGDEENDDMSARKKESGVCTEADREKGNQNDEGRYRDLIYEGLNLGTFMGTKVKWPDNNSGAAARLYTDDDDDDERDRDE
ncbi:hypothetical protein PV325_006577 [Microctonus aethiopoides]|nr:hypothetical protein PV325_006577 [Microctonus aethiopoides]